MYINVLSMHHNNPVSHEIQHIKFNMMIIRKVFCYNKHYDNYFSNRNTCAHINLMDKIGHR
jgi:hypothetical protein